MKSLETNISISREASNAIKGLLIILIVLGHNSILCRSWNGCESVDSLFHWDWFYTFHVYCFFILPFFYNKNPYRKGNIRKNVIKLLYPYLWVTLLCLTLSVFVMGTEFKGWRHFGWTWISGSGFLLEEAMGLNFPWFLPAMFTLLLFKDIYFFCGKKVRGIMIGISLVLWGISLTGMMKFSTMGIYVPFALIPAFRLLPVCLSTVWIAEKLKSNITTRILVTAVFALLTLLFWLSLNSNIHMGRMVFYFLMPVAAFLTLLQFKDYLAKSRLLVAFGKLSLQIYLYHVIIYNGLLLVVKHFHCPPTLIDGVFVLIVTLFVSYLGAWLTTRIPLLQKMLYPRSGK